MKQIINNRYGKKLLYIFRSGGVMHFRPVKEWQSEWTIVRFNNMLSPDTNYFGNCDIRNGIPFEDESFDAVYAMHIVEHLNYEENKNFVSEIFRILKYGSVARLSTPDLHNKVVQYFEAIENYKRQPNLFNYQRFQLALALLIDQQCRTRSGGKLEQIIKSKSVDQDYRSKGLDIFHSGENPKLIYNSLYPNNMFKKIVDYGIRKYYDTIGFRHKQFLEKEKWMFDDVSIKLLLSDAGFGEVSVCTPSISRIPNWNDYLLDQDFETGRELDYSVYAEGIKA